MSIKELAERYILIRDKLDSAKEVVTELQKEFDYVRRIEIPEVMNEVGTDSMRIPGVGSVRMSADLWVSMSDRADAQEWLKANGFTDIITEYCHPSTLKAFIKEQIREGTELPEELFKVTPYQQAIVTRK